MLLKNYIVELGLVNGSIGTVQNIIYKNKQGPHQSGSLPAYVIVNFPECQIPENDKCFENYPRSCVPIPVDEFKCELFCCSATTVPLRVCKAISIHKCQGISIGPGKRWEKVCINLPKKSKKKKQLLIWN